MTPDDIEALRRQVKADQDRAGLVDYLETTDRAILESTPELDQAQSAGLIPSAEQERDAIHDFCVDLGGSEASTDIEKELDNLLVLAQRYLNGSINPEEARFQYGELHERVWSILRDCAVAGWMAALDKHGLLPPEPIYEEQTGEPFPQIEGL